MALNRSPDSSYASSPFKSTFYQEREASSSRGRGRTKANRSWNKKLERCAGLQEGAKYPCPLIANSRLSDFHRRI